MKSHPKINQTKSLSELLKAASPSLLSRRIELDENFCQQACQWPEQVLDFSPYEDLEYLEVKGGGEISKIKVSQNKKLRSLIIPNQALSGVLDLSNNSELEEINLARNFLNTLKVHGKFSQKLKGLASKYLQPQEHNSAKIHPVRDVTVVLLNMGEAAEPASSSANNPPLPEKKLTPDNSTKTTASDEKPAQDLGVEKNQKISQLEKRLQLLEESRNEMVSQREEKIEELEHQLEEKEAELAKLRKSNQQLGEENRELRQQLEEIQLQEVNWTAKIARKKSELQSLKNSYEAKMENQLFSAFLETLLISQAQIKRLGEGNSSLVGPSERQLEKARQRLLEKLSEEEINKLRQIQNELTQLEIQSEELEVKVEVKK